MTPTREEILASARAMYGEASLTEVLALLDDYGTESHEPEVNRVKWAVLQLSQGKTDPLRYLVKCAKVDYRDVLSWQEVGPLSPQDGAKWQAMAQSLIDRWGTK